MPVHNNVLDIIVCIATLIQLDTTNTLFMIFFQLSTPLYNTVVCNVHTIYTFYVISK